MKNSKLTSLALLFAMLTATLFTSCGGDDDQAENKVDSVAIVSANPLQLETKGSITLAVEVLPKNATDKSIIWESSDEAVVAVDKSGTITGISKGTAEITATSASRKSKTATITVNVVQPVPVTAISLADVTIEIDTTVTISATVTPAGFTSALAWRITNNSVATITPISGSNQCTVTGKAAGTTDVAVTADNGKTAKCTITVLATRIALAKQTIDIGETVTVKAEVSPSNVAINNPTWTIANTAIATITPTGNQCKVEGKAVGNTRLTLTASGITASCDVKVLPAGAVLINGVIWSTRNVATAGTFSATPETWGWFYQWNRKKAYETESVAITTGWDSTEPTGTTWEAANDPSPSGWRVPTIAEFATLCDYTKVDAEWKTQNGENGMLFTDKTTRKKMFMPAGGQRHPDTGTYMNYELKNGYYWSSTAYQSTYARFFHFDDFKVQWEEVNGVSRTYGRPIRPVLKD